jgi:hypothetical protein
VAIVFAGSSSLIRAGQAQAAATTLYSNGFELNVTDWDAIGGLEAIRVASGTNGVTSRSGDFHAQSALRGSLSRWGGYNFGAGSGVPTAFQEYTTSVDVYLDVEGGWVNNTRFDFDSSINDNLGFFKRDFVFNAGFYSDTDGSPGSGTSRFVISASNDKQPGFALPKNPGRGPIAISASGWYTFEHHFRDNGGGLAVDMTIHNSSGGLVNTWTLTDPTALITGFGGNRSGWFNYNEFSVLAFDNASLVTNDVANTPPVAEAGGPYLGADSSPIALIGSGTDADEDSVTCGWIELVDSPNASVADTAGCNGALTATVAGVYEVKLTVCDRTVCVSDTATVVVYDPDVGFVTGGGWITSLPGAYNVDPLLGGRAEFGFVSKYEKGESSPSGQTQFNLQVGDLNFFSTTYQWLAVAGPLAQFRGTGTINGTGNYGFLLRATDGSPDKFNIHIWDIDDANATVYENSGDTALGGGSIVIHAK